jgi:hypothetical protein
LNSINNVYSYPAFTVALLPPAADAVGWEMRRRKKEEE